MMHAIKHQPHHEIIIPYMPGNARKNLTGKTLCSFTVVECFHAFLVFLKIDLFAVGIKCLNTFISVEFLVCFRYCHIKDISFFIRPEFDR